MKNKNKRYNDKDIQIICDNVSKYPQNLELAFGKAAKKIGRTKNSVRNKYYTIENKTILAIGTSKGIATNNRKVVRVKKENTLNAIVNNLSMKQRIDLLHLLVGLPPKEIGKFVANNVKN